MTVDGDYCRWPQTLDGYKSSLDNDEMLYQDHLASVRKDVECAFGILKKRFRMLPLPFQVRDGIDSEKIFKTCMIIHNMLPVEDGLDSIGDLDGDWLTKDVNASLENNRGGVCLHSAAFSTGRRLKQTLRTSADTAIITVIP